MEYCIDTSVYIQAHRTYYAFDIAPLFWKALVNLADNEIIVSPIAVYEELMQGADDDLKQWAKYHRHILFVEPDDHVVTAYRQIADFTDQHYAAHWTRNFLGGADPWVVAQAKAYNLVVTTMEGTKSMEEVEKITNRFKGRIKIPNLCGHFDIRCISTFDLLRTQKIGLG